jgi:tetraacyldisaccharide 4'-kinase
MTSFRRHIERVMMQGDPEAPAVSSPLEGLLYAGSRIYRLVVRLRICLYRRGVLKRKKLPCKVVSIGNITVGGTGKTPMVHYVAQLLKELGQEVAVISRGYGGSGQRLGGIVSDGHTRLMDARVSGDEPQLLSSRLQGIPVLIGRDRYRTGKWAVERFGSSIIVLDDGFQHLSLHRDLDLVLLDSVRPFGNGHCLPRGVLREPPEQIKRADALILTRWKEGKRATGFRDALLARVQGRPVFRCKHEPDGLFTGGRKESVALDYLSGKRLFLFSGIVRNDSFLEAVSRLEAQIVGSTEFGDHYRYSDHDLRLIWEKARLLKADHLMTTEKDHVNLSCQIPSSPELLVLRIAISFGEDTEAFKAYVKNRVS